MNINVVLKDLRLATFYGKQSVEAYQNLRSDITGLDKNIQKTFLRVEEPTYRALAELLIEQGRLGEAHQVLNAFKDQQFFDFDGGQQGRLAALTLTPREAELVSRLNTAVGGINTGGGAGEELAARLKTAYARFDAALTQAEVEFSKPPDEKDQVGATSDTARMQAALRQLGQDTGQTAAAVYTLAGREKYYALIVTADGINSTSSPVAGDELNRKERELWGLLQSDAYDPTALSKELYDAVFRPVEAKLPADTKTILWSLDGNLRYVPMAALYDGQRYLVERYNHVNFTRADPARMTRPVTRGWTATGLGTSAAHTVELRGEKLALADLPGVGRELRLLVSGKGSPQGLFEGEALQDARFTRAAMLTALRRKRPVVHIASHFSFRPGDEERSFLLLGDGTAFTLAEMKREGGLFEGVELLTLSACNTAAQLAGADGREVDAFAELAQRLGADAVLATLWPVADGSTPWLMREFYRTKLKQTLNKAEALRQAQLALLRGRADAAPSPRRRGPKVEVLDGDVDTRLRQNTRADVVFVEAKNAVPFKKARGRPFAHPFYWSPFVLIGNWR
jgi:CHAT domain-containing protein